MIRTARTAFIVIGSALLTPVWAGEIFFDEARVLESEPVYETRVTPRRVQECGYEESTEPRAANPAVLGNARANTGSITDALRADMRLRMPTEPAYRCHMVTRMDSNDELIGYRVRYEYADRVYESHIGEAPGDTIRVRVRLVVGRPELITQRDHSDIYVVVN